MLAPTTAAPATMTPATEAVVMRAVLRIMWPNGTERPFKAQAKTPG